MTFNGEELYTEYRKSWNKAAARRVHQAGIPRWKDLKPWMKRVWNDMAYTMTMTREEDT